MLESINVRSNVAVFLQIENNIRFAVAAGKLKAGDKLPSVRDLSTTLDLNPNTVAKAYRDLEVLGIVYTRRGMGVYIRHDCEQKCREECLRQVMGRMHEVVCEGKSAGLTQKEIVDVVKASYGTDADPYADAPEAVLSLSRSSGKRGK